MSAQDRRNRLAQLQGSMMAQSGKVLATWQNVPGQSLVATAVMKKKDQGGVAAGALTAAGKAAAQAKGLVIKAGTITYAVLNTSINSDNTTPILATIVSGPLKGSKLIGSFVKTGMYSKQLAISFTQLNNPSFKTTLGISCVAIDPSTARTALSGQVNNHYLMRYGSLLASSFLQGVGTAYQGATSTIVTTAAGSAVSYTPPNTKQLVMVGLGQVGSKWGQQVSTFVNRPVTIKIASGTGVGILITADLRLPGPLKSDNDDTN